MQFWQFSTYIFFIIFFFLHGPWALSSPQLFSNLHCFLEVKFTAVGLDWQTVSSPWALRYFPLLWTENSVTVSRDCTWGHNSICLNFLWIPKLPPSTHIPPPQLVTHSYHHTWMVLSALLVTSRILNLLCDGVNFIVWSVGLKLKNLTIIYLKFVLEGLPLNEFLLHT